MKTMEELFHALLQDVYYAEKQLTKALPKMAKEADDAELKKAFTDHLEETEGHIERLERAFEMIGKPARGKKCEAIIGIIDEGKLVTSGTRSTVMQQHPDCTSLEHLFLKLTGKNIRD